MVTQFTKPRHNLGDDKLNKKVGDKGMRALKITDLMVIGLFVLGILVGITQKINHGIVHDKNVVETISQQDDTINPTS